MSTNEERQHSIKKILIIGPMLLFALGMLCHCSMVVWS
jgi:hypothetical protein